MTSSALPAEDTAAEMVRLARENPERVERKPEPACFALVMATGIVSIAAELLGMRLIALPFFAINCVFYLLLSALMLRRIVRFPRHCLNDLADHRRGAGFLTWPASTCTLAMQCLLVVPLPRFAAGLWGLGIALWLLTTYSFLAILIVKPRKPTLVRGVDGGWLLMVVATQSVSVVGSNLTAMLTSYAEHVLFLAFIMWLCGAMLYIWLAALIFYRCLFLRMEPADLVPTYWINMGAAAITTLAGAGLILAAPRAGWLEELLPFIKGLTLLFWSIATWWIPLLVILDLWRYLQRRFPFRYEPLVWGAVFPLGMYTACTYQLGDMLKQSILLLVSRCFIFIALAAWLVAFLGLSRRVVERFIAEGDSGPTSAGIGNDTVR